MESRSGPILRAFDATLAINDVEDRSPVGLLGHFDIPGELAEELAAFVACERVPSAIENIAEHGMEISIAGTILTAFLAGVIWERDHGE